MIAIYVLWLRQLKRYARSRARIVASIAQPLLYLLALGFGFGPIFQQAGQGSYLQFIAPGVVAMTVLFTAVFSGIELIWDKQFGFLKETLVAPVPRVCVMLGRTLGGATVAMAQGTIVLVICLIAGYRVQNVAAVPVALAFMALIGVMFAALGTAIASVLSDAQAFPLIMNFVVMPIYFLSGALFPLKNLPRPLEIATRLDPLSYGVDGLRHALNGTGHFPLAADAGVLAGVVAALVLLGAYSFSKIEL